jgi:GDP-D-mannose dehydratase
LIDKGYEVHGLIRRSSTFNTSRIDHLYVVEQLARFGQVLGDSARSGDAERSLSTSSAALRAVESLAHTSTRSR